MTFRTETIGDAVMILGDCREVLPTLGSFDACVTDPPYGNPKLLSGGNGRSHSPLPNSGPRGGRRIAAEPMIGNGGPFDPSAIINYPEVILWGANHYANKLPPRASWLVWDKREGQASDNGSDCEMAWTNLSGPARLYRQLWRGMVVRGEGNGALRVHPTQKSIGLMLWCLSFVHGQHILDPFAGVGTTGVACARLGRRFTGIEIHEPYFDIACRRIERAQRQRDLFIEAPVAESMKAATLVDLFALPVDPADERAASAFEEPA